jgi:pimeloyl-ACP methyl ester carboxylesterase
VPDLPGFGKSTRPDWARDVRDLAVVMAQFLDTLGLADVTLAGCGFGGWVAAELATVSQRQLRRLVLVGAAGIQPRQGVIVDQLVIDYVEYGGREMTMRVTFKPWMFRRALPHLLRGVQTPALVVWGSEDRIVPPDCGEQYAAALPHAELLVLEGAGHFLDFEQPEWLADAIAGVSVAARG